MNERNIEGAHRRRGGDPAQYAVCGFLALVGALVIVDASQLWEGANDLIGPRLLPMVLGVLLLVIAMVYAIDVIRGGRGQPETGDDVDVTTPIDWRTVMLLVGVLAVNVALIEWLGWVISGAFLFWGTAFALGSRRYVLDLAIAVTLSLASFYGLVIGLGVYLPAGVLQGIL
jgi:putative tricarboxylic transport membrane protein